MQSGELALHGAAMGDWGLPFRDYIQLNNILSFGLVFVLVGATATTWFHKSRKTPPSSPDVQLGSCQTGS
jgi:hypothetical protein